MATAPITHAWLEQALDGMAQGISEGKTRRRKIHTLRDLGITEVDLVAAVDRRGWRVAQVGDDYIFAPGGYAIRPIV